MSDYEKFAQYWEQAVNGLAYRIGQKKIPTLPRSVVQAMWREELLDKRFCSAGVKHGARVFLDELEQTRPETARRVRQQLQASVMPLGIQGTELLGKACVAGASLAAACSEKAHRVVRLSAGVVGTLFTAKTAQDVWKGVKTQLLEALERESAIQLQEYKALFESQVQ